MTFAQHLEPLFRRAGFRIVETLGESLHTIVFKGYRESNPDRLLVLKLLRAENPSPALRRYLQRKSERLKIINHPFIVTPSACEYYGDLNLIIQDFHPGVPLDQWERTHGPASLDDFFFIALNLSQMLSVIHDAGVIHGGLKPHNILIDEDTRTVRLIDFLSPLDIREISHFIYDPGFVEGTLAYSSPEQTGRISHRVDYPTDMYSLSVILFEMLTGRKPFRASDPLELIHSHLAESAPKVQELRPELPSVLGEIIAKLGMKEPEKRYQSGYGLYADLKRCEEAYREHGAIADFPLGTHNHTRRVVFISKMVGRDREARVVLGEYQRVLQGGFRAIFISGPPGIGKTRLIQELQRPLVANRGYFTSGKFDQYQKNIPYSSLLQALRNLIRTLLTESDERVAVWKRKLQAGLGEHGQVIVDVLPELGLLIGPQPPVAPLPPVEARNRFNRVFNVLLASLASAENPLVLFIDDLQWCDSATFDFLNSLFACADEHPHLFFLGAYRNTEVDSAHPLSALVRAIQSRRQPLTEVAVAPLEPRFCHEMVAYILDAPAEHTQSLANFLAELTEGNPLFVSESLSYLHNEELLYFGETGEWQWNIDKIRDSEMPASVVDLFGSKVRKLPPETLDILTVCACMGNRFTPDDIALIKELDFTQLYERLRPVLSLGLLTEHKTEIQFVHDRVQEAVLRVLDPHRRKAIHWQIGQHLLRTLLPDTPLESQDNLFTVVAHLNLGKPDESDPESARQLSDLNYHAGNKALNALATQAANGYFAAARALLPDDSWQTEYQRSFDIYRKHAKTELMCGRQERSQTLIEQLIAHAQSNLDKAEALAEQTTSLSSIGNFIDAIATANRGLAYFDRSIPEDPEEARAKMEHLMAEIHGEGQDLWDRILHMPFTQERKSKIELAFYSELIPDLYMSGLVPQLYLSAAQSTELCLAGGMDESVIYSFSIMGLNLGEQEQFDLAFRYEDLAHDLCVLHPNTFGATRGMNGIVWCNMHSRSHPADIVEYCLKSTQCGKNCGDLYNAGLSYGPLMWNLIAQGANFSSVEHYAGECLEFSRKNQLAFSIGLAEAVQMGWIAPMQGGVTPEPMDERLTSWEHSNHIASAGSYHALKGFSHYFLGECEEAQSHLDAVEHYLNGLTDNVLKRLWYVFRILAALRLHERHGEETDRAKVVEAIAPLLWKVETWASLGPLLRPYLALIHAELERSAGNFAKTRASYLDAIDTSRRFEYVFLEGFLNQRLGQLLNLAGKPTADIHIREARRLYHSCRATAMAARLQIDFREMLERIDEAEAAPLPSIASADSQRTLPNLDVDYLLKSSLAIVAETDREGLWHRIMNVVIECSGAQRGYFMVREGDELVIRAESEITEKARVRTDRRRLSEAANICKAIVHYVFHTREKVQLDDACNSGDFALLPEVQALQLRSVLCLPVIKQSDLVGVLFLENRLAEGVFTADKVQMTELLTAHIAISLQNARLLAETREGQAQIQELNAELERRVLERTAQLAAANKELESFSYSISHDLRAPLRSINGFSRLLMDRHSAQLDSEGMDYLNRVCRASDRMGLLIDDLLKLSRITQAGLQLRMVNVSALAMDIIQELRAAAPDREVEFTADPGIELQADPGLLRIALQNLLANAFKFTRHATPACIRLEALRMADGKGFVVRDNGVGFDTAFASKLFAPFQRLHSLDQFEGIGIGLAIVQRVVNRHGGRIWAESSPGNGASFFVQLP